jgi:hypothetical protein
VGPTVGISLEYEGPGCRYESVTTIIEFSRGHGRRMRLGLPHLSKILDKACVPIDVPYEESAQNRAANPKRRIDPAFRTKSWSSFKEVDTDAFRGASHPSPGKVHTPSSTTCRKTNKPDV